VASKSYNIFLDENKIGTTELEKADASMGVAFGKIRFIDINSGYEFFKQYCSKNKIEFTDHPEDKLILTQNIHKLKVIDKDGVEITGISVEVSGMDSDIFDITILGILYPFYEQEFPHHVKAYNEMFK
jgi:hypothetical protein